MSSLRQQILTKVVLPLGGWLSKQDVMGLYDFYNQSQWWSAQQLADYQNQRLQALVTTAFNEVPLYRELYEKAGISPADIQSVEDLAKLPVINKDNFRASTEDQYTRETGLPTSTLSTSGSSGQPFTVVTDSLAHSHARALMFLRATMSGWEIGEPHLQTGISVKRGWLKSIKDQVLACHYASAYDLSNAALDDMIDRIIKHKLAYIMGYPGSVFFIAKRVEERGLSISLKGVVTWGDNLYAHYRQQIEQTFGCKVNDTYGIGEGIQIAAQSPEDEGIYHVFMTHVIVEVVDDEGRPVADGEVGNIVLTRLYPGAMPLIRYQVGDLGRKRTGQRSPSGRYTDQLLSIEGRDTDVILTPNGNRLIVHFFTGILEYYSEVTTFRILQDSIEKAIVEIQPAEGFNDQVWHAIKAELEQMGAADLEFELKLVDEIPLPKTGKRRFIISSLNKDRIDLNKAR